MNIAITKRISINELQAIVKLSKHLHPGIACNRIGRYYRLEQNKRSNCTRACKNCAGEIRHFISGTSDGNISDLRDKRFLWCFGRPSRPLSSIKGSVLIPKR